MSIAIALKAEQAGTRSAVALRPQQGHLWSPMADEGVGDRLRRFRRLRRLTQEQLSEQAGVRRDYIGNLERGAIGVPRDPEQLRLLANVLGVRLRDLAEPTGWYDDDGDLPSWEAALRADPRFNEEDKAALLRAGRAMILAGDKSDQEAAS